MRIFEIIEVELEPYMYESQGAEGEAHGRSYTGATLEEQHLSPLLSPIISQC